MIDDEALKKLVLDELRWDSRVDATDIGVTTSDGSVTLLGHVTSYPEKYAACEAVKHVRGVRAIADEIKVHLRSEQRLDDSDIAERVAHVLQWNVSSPSATIQAKVSDGIVSLTGEVEWQHQRSQIEGLVRHVVGVAGVNNGLKIRQRIIASDVKKRIEEALHRNAEVEAGKIKVSVTDDRVTLDGKVNAYYERDLVERAAWAAPGVRHVDDHLTVD